MKNEIVSIITPSYKSEKYISQTIESVLSQHYQDWELIIVDDCSPDNSNEIVSEYIKKDKRIKLLRLEKNVGPAGARNVGIKEAKGRYVAFLDSDDLWKPQKLTEQIKFMQEFNLTITYCSYELIDENNKSLGTFTTKEEITYKDLLKNNYIGTSTVIYDTQKLGKIFMPSLPVAEDYATWLKVLKQINKTKGLLEPLVLYRVRKRATSFNKLKVAFYRWKIYREFERLDFLTSAYYFLNYAYYATEKYTRILNKQRFLMRR